MKTKELASEAGRRWKAMSDDERAPYLERNSKAKAEYEIAMATYRNGGEV